MATTVNSVFANGRKTKWLQPQSHFFISMIQGHLNTYRFCDNVWTFVLNDVEFRNGDFVTVDKVKIVAVDGKSSASASQD